MLFTFITNFLYKLRITDVMTCYKVFRRDVIMDINFKSDGFDIEPELVVKICKGGYEVYEVPTSYHPRSFRDGKKIKFSDSFSVIWALIKYKFVI